MATQDTPITLARIERAFDRLAIIMTEDPEIAHKALPIFERLDREAEALRAREETNVQSPC
jgi:hypothetical protein